mgnify:CR=1 FL=1
MTILMRIEEVNNLTEGKYLHENRIQFNKN